MRLGILPFIVIFKLAARRLKHNKGWRFFVGGGNVGQPWIDENLVTGYHTPNGIPTISVHRRTHRSIVNIGPKCEPSETNTKK